MPNCGFAVFPATLGDMNVGERVIRRRAQLGISQRQLADAADVAPATLRSLEQDRRWPHDTTRSAIEFHLGWKFGSLDRMREGQDPELLSPSELRHPMRQASLAAKRLLAREGDDSLASDDEPVRELSVGPVKDGDLDSAMRQEVSDRLDGIRKSVRILATLPDVVQELVLDGARQGLPFVIEALDDERERDLIEYAYRLLDEQDEGHSPGADIEEPDSPAAHVGPSWDDLPRVANRRGREPEEGDDDYGSGA